MTRFVSRSANLFLNIKNSLSSPELLINSSRKLVTLSCNPQPATCDDVMRLQFVGLPPSSEVRVNCSIVLPEIVGRSFGTFRTNDNGCLDLASSPSSGPSYHGVDPMGLFWAMDLKSPVGREMIPTNIMEPLPYEIRVTDLEGNELSKSIIKRNLVNPGVRRIPVNSSGIVGTMFVPPGEGPFPALISLYGAKGVNEPCAAYLANHGFATLGLAFWGMSGLPSTYSQLDIEYFEDAVDFLQEQDFVRGDTGVGVFGRSKGGEIALSMAAFLPKNKVTAVAVVGSPIASIGGTTSYKGETISAHGFKEDFKFSQLSVVNREFRRIVRPSACMAPLETLPQCRIPFERSEADLLVVVGEDDLQLNWFCEDVAEEAKRVCEEFGKKNVEIKRFPGMGHLLLTPYSPICTTIRHPLVPDKGVFIDMGGSDKQQNSKSQILAWEEIIDFLKTHLTY